MTSNEMEPLEKLWEEFDKEMQSYDEECNNCDYLHQWSEAREFWGAPCHEDLAECTLPGDKLLECPRFAQWLIRKGYKYQI